MPDAADIYMAKDTFVDFSQTGGPMRVNLHATARAGHPIIKANPTMWVPLTVDFEVEQPKAEPKAEAKAEAKASGRKGSGG